MDTSDIVAALVIAFLAYIAGVIVGHLWAIGDYYVAKQAQWRIKRSLLTVWIWPAYALWVIAKGFCNGFIHCYEALNWFYTGDDSGEQWP